MHEATSRGLWCYKRRFSHGSVHVEEAEDLLHTDTCKDGECENEVISGRRWCGSRRFSARVIGHRS